MFASLYKIAREGTLIVGSLVAFVGTPAIAAASPVRGAPQPTIHGSTGVSTTTTPAHGSGTAGTTAGAPAGSSSSSSSSSSSGSGSSFKDQLLIGAGFAAAWLAGLPIGPGKTVAMSTTERLVKGVGGIGLIAGGVMALVAAFGSGFSLLGFGEAIAGLGMLAFGLHFGLSALWGKKNDGNLVVNHTDNGANGTNGSTNAGNNTGRPGNTAPGTGVGARLPDLGHFHTIPNLGGIAANGGANMPRSSSTVPTGSVSIPASRSGTADNINAGVHR